MVLHFVYKKTQKNFTNRRLNILQAMFYLLKYNWSLFLDAQLKQFSIVSDYA